MAERFSSTGGNQSGAPPSWLEDYLFAPSAGYGWARDEGSRRGDVTTSFIDPLNLAKTGSSKYGLTAWDDMFGDGGQIMDMDALIRSLNFGAVTGQEGSRGFGGSSGKSDAGATGREYFGDFTSQFALGGNGLSPNMGELDYFTDDYLDFRGWENGVPPGVFFGDRATSKYIKKTGKNPFKSDMHEWLYDMSFKGKERGSRWGRKRTDAPGYWYDPANAIVSAEDLAGIDNLNDLNQWALDEFGVDALTLAGTNQDLLAQREAFRADPSQFWSDGRITANSIEGLHEADFALRMEGMLEEMAAREAYGAAERERAASDAFYQEALNDPHFMRTSLGQAMAELLPEQMQATELLNPMSTALPDYGFGFTRGVNPYLMELQKQQMRYGY